MNEIVLSALDGRNPIAFLAALGVLNALSDRVKGGKPVPKLAWRLVGTFRPVVVDGPPREELASILADDLGSFAEEPAITALTAPGDGDSSEDDLKTPVDRFRRYLLSMVGARATARSATFAAAFATDVATDKSIGNTKPTALHFTAGQQHFLAMVTELRDGVRAEHFDEALFGPWRYASALPVLGWDNATSRDYALRAGDPSKEKKLGVPGADWLAFRGLPFMVVAPDGRAIVTAGCHGRWKSGTFRWPLWSSPLSRRVIGSLVTSPELNAGLSPPLQARGVAMVFESSIRRSDQGGYGSFSPARVATSLPTRGRGPLDG